MTLKCRLCGEIVALKAQAPPEADNSTSQLPLNLKPPSGGALRQHLERHKWQILRLIQGTEGDGSFARLLEVLLFEARCAPGEDGITNNADRLYDADRLYELQHAFLEGALAPEAMPMKEGGK